jgi:uncharacterized protein DUF1566/centrosomal CEP192-like protein
MVRIAELPKGTMVMRIELWCRKARERVFVLDRRFMTTCITKTIFVATVCFVMQGVVSIASEISLPRTGLTASYGSGDDGAIKAGLPWPSPRFTAENGAVTDNLTGLIWLQNANCFGSKKWADALSSANNLENGMCSLSDNSTAGQWRLPTRLELESLLDISNIEPALPSGHPFSDVQSTLVNTVYWSSSTHAANSMYAWGVWMDHGYVYGSILDKNDFNNVWPVRNGMGVNANVPMTGQVTAYGTRDDGASQPGVPWPAPRFTDNSNGTATDNLTGLIWLKDANCTETVGGIAKETGTLSWADALTWSNSLASGYCGLSDASVASDWRLPNRKELQSLVDSSKTNPPLPDGHPFSNIQSNYYATSSYWNNPISSQSGYWHIKMGDGHILLSGYPPEEYVWPVRGGQFGNSVITVLPLAKDFGAVTVGGSHSQTITISNIADSGSSRLQVNAITLRGTDAGQFSIHPGDGSGGTCGSLMPVLDPGSSCTMTANFNPTSTGAKSAILRISSSDVNAPNTDLSLTGNFVYTVTASVNDENGTITSVNPVNVASGSATTFTLAPADNSYHPSNSVSGSCQTGYWNGNQYTTGPVTADCTVIFSFTKITYTLSVSTSGTGSGTVTSIPTAISCTSGSVAGCSSSFTAGTSVQLTARPQDWKSIFSGWSEGCTGTETCSLTMNASTSAIATFTSNIRIKLANSLATHASLQDAYNDANDNEIFLLQVFSFPENLNFNRAINVKLRGGKDSSYSSNVGVTSIQGSVTISGGSVDLSDVEIR